MTASERASDRQHPEHIAPAHADEYAQLSSDERRLLTPDVLARWAGDLTTADYTLGDVLALELKRQANLRTIRQGAELGDMEWRLWRYLARQAGRVRTFPQIAHHLFGTTERPITPRMLRQIDGYDSVYIQAIRRYVSNLRRKLEVDPLRPQHFATVRGVGYVFYDKPPAADDGINYARRELIYARLRVNLTSLINPDALPGGGMQPDEYLDADIVDAVSVSVDGELTANVALEPGPEYDRIQVRRASARARRNQRSSEEPTP